MPAFKNLTGVNMVPNIKGPAQPQGFNDDVPVFAPPNITVTGISRDSGGVALGNCVVKLFDTATDTKWLETVSDASGNFSFDVARGMTYYVVAYLPGSPDVAGTTVNTLVGT